MDKYQIITDATADLAADLAASYDIESIPMEINLDEETYTFVPGGGNIDLDNFYNRMLSGSVARTSQINPLVYLETFEKYFALGKDIIYICLSSGLSATIQGAQLSADQLKERYPHRKIYIIDSLCASVGEAFLVIAAAEQQKAGKNIDELATWLEDNKLKICHWFTVENLEYLKRGGRLSSVQAALGTTLNLKPVLHVDNEGHLINVKKVRGRNKSLNAMLEELKQRINIKKDNRIFIGQAACQNDADYLSELITKEYPEADIKIYDIGPVIGAHAGPGVIAIFFWGENR